MFWTNRASVSLQTLWRFLQNWTKTFETTDAGLLSCAAKLMLNQVKAILLCLIVSLMMPLSLQCYSWYYAWCLLSSCLSCFGLFDSDVVFFFVYSIWKWKLFKLYWLCLSFLTIHLLFSFVVCTVYFHVVCIITVCLCPVWCCIVPCMCCVQTQTFIKVLIFECKKDHFLSI